MTSYKTLYVKHCDKNGEIFLRLFVFKAFEIFYLVQHNMIEVEYRVKNYIRVKILLFSWK